MSSLNRIPSNSNSCAGLIPSASRHNLESGTPWLALLEPEREAEWRGCRGKSQEVVVQNEQLEATTKCKEFWER